MDRTFSKLVHYLTDHRRKFVAVFGKAVTGTVRTDDIWVMILMNALSDDQFPFMKGTMYSKNLKDAFPTYAVVLQDMQNYDLNRRKPAAKPESTAPVGSTILSASSLNPSQTKCTKCSEMFNTTMRKVGTGIYTICFKCSTEARKTREAAAAHPTPAQVAGAQASLKKAQAVLLAASVADNQSSQHPIIPPPTQREHNSINSYIESPYYSLSATTTTTPSQLPATLTAEPTVSRTYIVLESFLLRSPSLALMAPSSMPPTLAPVVSILASGSTSSHTPRSSYSVLVPSPA